MSNSSLINHTRISPNKNHPRNHKIDKITIHHMAGDLTVERCGEEFAPASRQGSSNYGIGTDGRVALYVDECDRAWTSGNRENDHRAVTIEVANDGGAPDWHVSDKALAKLIDLCVDICKRNGIDRLNYTGDKNGNLTMHCMFQATTCPGAYLKSKFPYIAEQVNTRLHPTVAKPTPKVSTKSSAILDFQKAAIADGYKFPKYGADGKWGNECIAVATKAICKKQLIGYKNKNLTKIIQKAVGVTADGLFGSKTHAAVIAYQKKNGLSADGIVGLNTWKKILGVK